VTKGLYNKLNTTNAILNGFFEQIPGIYIVKVRVGVNSSANHYIVVNSWTGQIIDPSYSFPISFQWAYTNGKLDKEKWKAMLNDLEYRWFETMYQMYSTDSRFSDRHEFVTNDFTGEANNKDGLESQDSRQQTDSTPKVKRIRVKECNFFKKGTCRNGEVCKFGHSTMELAIMEVVLGATAVNQFFCNGLTHDILETIIGVQIR